MKAAGACVRWFVIGMGHVLGISPAVPKLRAEGTIFEVIGGDFHAVGNDLRTVMHANPATEETARGLGQPTQLNLAGIK